MSCTCEEDEEEDAMVVVGSEDTMWVVVGDLAMTRSLA